MWTPPPDQVVTRSGWTPPPDQVVSDGIPPQKTSPGGQKLPFIPVAKAFLNEVLPQAHPIQNAPIIGGVLGNLLYPGLGGAAGAGIGQMVSRMGEIADGSPVGSPLAESVGPMIQTAAAGLPEVGGVQKFAQNAAQNLGRRALGVTKGMLGRLKGGIPQANQAAQEMLDQGVIKPFSGAKATLDRAEQVAATSGKAVGDALSSTGEHALDTNAVNNEIINQLAPKFQGGAYAQQENVANEIVNTISAHGDGPIDFESAQKLKNTLKQMAGNNWNTDRTKAAMYQKAYAIVSDAMEKSVQDAGSSGALPVMERGMKTGDPHALFAYNDEFGPGGSKRAIYNVYGDPAHPAIKATGWGSSVAKDALDAAGIPIVGAEARAAGSAPAGSMPNDVYQQYLRNKQIYGASQTAIKGLEDKANAEATNSIVSLRGAALGAGALAAGHVTPALEALGAWEAARRVGAATGASAMNSVAKSLGGNTARQALMSEFINRAISKVQR